MMTFAISSSLDVDSGWVASNHQWMTSRFIPVPWKLPSGYKRTFTFEDADAGLWQRITVANDGLLVEQAGTSSWWMRWTSPAKARKADSRCLDWIQQSIESVREELGV